MKQTKILVVTLLAGFVLHQPASCQTNPADASPPAATAAATNTAASAVAETGNQPVSLAASNEPVSTVTMSNAAVVAVVESNTTAGTVESNATAATVESNAPAAMVESNAVAEAGSTNAPTAESTNTATAKLPIQFQDVPITTAIESLARLAGINYLLDPKIGYGQPDQSGQIKPEPTLSLRWENVTAKQALLALLDNYGLQLVENPKTGIDRITIKEPNALPPLITRVIQLKYASTSNMTAAVTSLLSDDRRSKVVADDRTSQLVVVATETEQAAVDTLVSNLDTPTRQVLIETKLVELSSNPSTEKGIDWTGTLGAQNFAFGNGVLSQSSSTTVNQQSPGTSGGSSPSGASLGSGAVSETVNKVVSTATQSGSTGPGGTLAGLAANTASGLNPATGFLTADGVSAVLHFLNQSKEAQVVSMPRVVTLDNETATIAVTQNFPVINVTASTAGVSSGSSQITYSNIGTILQVTPRITANDYIWLKVVPDISSFVGSDNKTIAGTLYQADIFASRHIETQVLIPNAHTLVMGGLVQDNPTAQYTKVPILGDIPVLGLAFRSENKSMQKDNLLIFITPTIVRDDDFRPTTTDFLNSKARTMGDPMKMHTWLDSSQPRGDWSNPLPDQADSTPNASDQNASNSGDTGFAK